MGTPLQFSMYQILVELQVPPERAHELSEAYNREREQAFKEVQGMVDKQLQSYVTQTEATKAEGRVEKAVHELRGDVFSALHELRGDVSSAIHDLRGDMLKSFNDLLRWVIGTQVAVAGLAIAAVKLL